ncbi:hypothetical protein [Paenibacillus apiarius]|uniref:hypothetical protein n=1 Tax=Paenibacillus apiarius TaxID=46240 RepID=UPI003B3B162A
MRNYYLLIGDERIDRKMEPLGIRKEQRFEDLPGISVLELNENVPYEFVDWLENPRRMASSCMKTIMEKYNRSLQFKRVDLTVTQLRIQHQYWIIKSPYLDSLSTHSEFLRDGTMKRLILDKGKIKGHHIFMIDGILEPYMVVSLDAAESLLRRSLTGFVLKEIEVM